MVRCQIAGFRARRGCPATALWRAQAKPTLPKRALLRGLLDRGGPVREVIQGFGVGGIEMEGSDGDSARENGGIIRVWRDVFVDALLEQPIVGAATRIFSFA